MNVGGETIQLSFGPAANAVTSHLCNLQGLAATTSENSEGGGNDWAQQSSLPLCDPYVTHAVQNEIYVPRVLFVDTNNHFSPWPTTTSRILTDTSHLDAVETENTMTSSDDVRMNWNGNIDVHHRTSSSSSSFVDMNDITTYSMKQLAPNQLDAMNEFQSIATSSSLSSNNVHSRYHSSKYQHVSSQFIYTKNTYYNQNERSINWDDLEEEEEEDDEYYKERKRHIEQQKWNQYEQDIQNDLNRTWDAFFNGIENHDVATKQSDVHSQSLDNDSTKNDKGTKSPLGYLSWLHYFMPPNPSFDWYAAPLPFNQIINTYPNIPIHANNTNNSHQTDQTVLYSHQCGKYPSSSSSSCNIIDGITHEWRDLLSDKLRKWLEDCDALKGIQIIVDNDKALFGGIASDVLEEMNDECKSAGKISILVHDGDAFDSFSKNNNVDSTSNNNGEYWRSERAVVNTFRSYLNDGLNLHGLGENSDLILPMSLSNCWNALDKDDGAEKTLFEASAVGALALEAMTLSYRLLKGNRQRSKVGIMSGYFQGSGQSDDNDVYPSVESLTYHEFISSLRPSNVHKLLELSGCLQNKDMYNQLIQGTSIERRRLEEERNQNRDSMYYRRSRGRDVSPGLWLEDSSNGGILSPLFPIEQKYTSRSMHRHFALSSSLRPNQMSSINKHPLSTFTTLIMEGMGITYRPQSSVSTTVGQSLENLTGLYPYAAGTYWKSIFGCGIDNVPVLSVIGNSTRIHSHLNTTSKNMTLSLSRKYQGYLSRDSVMGMVPEREDCTDALEGCMSLRDTYEPPMMFDDEEGEYFDDNSD